MSEDPDFLALPDLASRTLGGGVPYANDELFAERENLIKTGPAVFSTEDFGHKGKIYDGWETRRRREPGHDHAVVRLGAPGVVRGVVIDTAWFRGNYPPYASVEATSVEGYPSPAELQAAPWQTIVERSPLQGDTANPFAVTAGQRFTHVRLSIYPDGGVARFRVHGEVVPDPRLLPATIDLAAAENGGRVVDCSDMFYSSPVNLITPGRAATMGEGWENARRRDDGNDFVTFALAAPGVIAVAELDTSHFVGNAPGWAALRGIDAANSSLDDQDAWFELLPRTRLQPDTPHRFRLTGDRAVTHVRMDVFPDGGLARVRLHGSPAPGQRDELGLRWFNALPETHAREVVAATSDGARADELVASRPTTDPADLPESLRGAFGT
ncbi:allantoicase [Pseudonocardia kunmingensis]|uniref:Probable allantoicase n=1 Tax=Pseudonocardia kunmingensis TaxID=630975 RepID=A0A543CXJ5_9PSEU|nr:allantoicase [Pseudonocardia kunmingensis]TQM01814.1 allantoicase [Pseudonocardia kunmingensis]